MKTKNKKLMISFALLMVLVLATINTNAASFYPTDITQNFTIVHMNDVVIITVTLDFGSVREEEITSARLSHAVDWGVRPSINPEETIPTRDNILTFDMGSFEADDEVAYKIYLEFQLTPSWQSEWYSFTVQSGIRIAGLSIAEIIGISVAGAVCLIAVIAIPIYVKKRK